MEDRNDKFRIKSEKLINESWSIIDNKFEDLVRIANQGCIKNKHDEAVALSAINVIIQNLVFHRTENEYYFGEDNFTETLKNIGLAPCGKTAPCGKHDDQCFFLVSDSTCCSD